jgi:hypothetical protein
MEQTDKLHSQTYKTSSPDVTKTTPPSSPKATLPLLKKQTLIVSIEVSITFYG